MKNNRTLLIVLAIAVLGVVVFMLMKEPPKPDDQTGNISSDTLERAPAPPCPCGSITISQFITHTQPASSNAHKIVVYDTVKCAGVPIPGIAVNVEGAGFGPNATPPTPATITDPMGIAKTQRNNGPRDSTGKTVTATVNCPGGKVSTHSNVPAITP